MSDSPARPKALLIGNSDGIGLAATRRLLTAGWEVIGVSRSDSPISAAAYSHRTADVAGHAYPDQMTESARRGPFDLCIYFAGIGEMLDPLDMSGEARIIEVNLTGMVRTAAAVIPGMVRRGQGHFIGVSSLADELLSPAAPSYHASKAGMSNYLGGLALALRPQGVHVTTVRFGFVDTKMAKGEVRPFMMSVERAVDHLEDCIRRKPRRHAAPAAAVVLVKLRRVMMALGAT